MIDVGSTNLNTRLIDLAAFNPFVLNRTYGFAPLAVAPVAPEADTPGVRPISTKFRFPVRSSPLILFIVTVCDHKPVIRFFTTDDRVILSLLETSLPAITTAVFEGMVVKVKPAASTSVMIGR